MPLASFLRRMDSTTTALVMSRLGLRDSTRRFASLCVARARARDAARDSSDANARAAFAARESARRARMMGGSARGTLRRGTPGRAGRERDDATTTTTARASAPVKCVN